MGRTELTQHGLHALRKHVPGKVHVGEQRVAADRGNLEGIENRACRRLFAKGHVRVPEMAEIDDLVGLLDDLYEFGKAVDAMHERVLLEATEAARKSDLLLGREVLVAKEQDEMIEVGVVQCGPRPVVERPGEVDSHHFRADGRGVGMYDEVRHNGDPRYRAHSSALIQSSGIRASIDWRR